MRNPFCERFAVCAIAVAGLAAIAAAQAQASGAQTTPAAPVSSAVANPTYVSIPREITVSRPAAEVWKRVGKSCDSGQWLQVPCTITSGKDGEIGAVRSLAGEVLVAK